MKAISESTITGAPPSDGLHNRISRFDLLVVVTLTLALILTIFLVWRGDRVGLTVTAVYPYSSGNEISVGSSLALTFAQDVANKQDIEFVIDPPTSGKVSWQGRTARFEPDAGLESDTTYSVTVPANLQGRSGRKMLADATWHFTTGHPRILYLTWDSANHNQLHLIDPEGGSPEQLTDMPAGILDYAVSSTGETVVFSALRDGGGADLFRLTLPEDSDTGEIGELLTCELAVCSGAAFSPDGRRLVYEKRTFAEPGAPPGPPRLWWLDIATGETVPVFEDSQWLGLSPRFSPDGNWLSYISPVSQEIHAYNLQTGQTVLIPSQTGEPSAWNPASDQLLVTEIQFQGEQFAVHIFAVDLETGELTNLSNELAISDGSPIFSPDGAWILFGRKVSRAPMGRQLWIMRPDGTELTALTTEPEIHNGLPAWSPDGSRLVMQRYAISEPGAEPGIWVLELETGDIRQIAPIGLQPQWLP